MPTINWAGAPEWARWAARDSNGSWWWHSQEPKRGEHEWMPRIIVECMTMIERANIRCNLHWMLSLTKRPKEQE